MKTLVEAKPVATPNPALARLRQVQYANGSLPLALSKDPAGPAPGLGRHDFARLAVTSGTPAAGSPRPPAGPIVQLRTDATPPPEMLEATEEQHEETTSSRSSEEGSDDGAAVASIDAGMPFLTTAAAPTNEAVESGKEENEELPVQRRAGSLDSGLQPVSSHNVVQALKGGGAPMTPQLRAGMEAFFGESFSSVRFHTGSRASSVTASFGAEALTVGDAVAFASGRFAPQTKAGQRLIAHELTHVVQQRRGVSGKILEHGIGHPDDRYEVEAERKASELARRSVQPTTPSIHSRRPTHDDPATSDSVVQLYSGTAAAAYAQKWANGTNAIYGRFSNDCTNFVSQAMLAGGWQMTIGSSYCDDRRKNSVWWFERDGCTYFWRSNVHASHTWGGAENFWQFFKASGRGRLVKKVSDLDIGDVLQADWTSDNTINHTMIVTKKEKGNIYLTYHTSDHLDEPFWKENSNEGIRDRSPSTTSYFGWKIV